MNLSKFFFKIAVTLAYVLGLMLITLPIAWVIVYTKEEGWRYGFTFIKNNFEVALFVSFAIGFMVSVYHALKFELIGESPLSNFLKSTQVVNVMGEQSVKELADSLQSNEYFWFKELNVNEDSITARLSVFYNYKYSIWLGNWRRGNVRLVLLSPDRLTISKENNVFIVQSSPFSKLWFIDFGRNFANVTEVAKAIKGIK